MPAFMMAGSAALQIGGSVFSGIMGKSAAKKQAEAIQHAQNKAASTATQYNDRAQGWLRSFRERGDTAGQSIQDIMSGKMNLDDMVQSSSLFKFQQQEGERGINRQLRARGLYGSGAGLETLSRFESQLVGEEGERTMSRLFQLNNSGQQAANQLANNEMTTGRSLADIALNGGMAKANAGYAGDMSIAGMGKSMFDAAAGGLNSGLQYKMYKPYLDKMAGMKPEPTADEIAAGEHQANLGRYIVANTKMPPTPGNEPGKWDFLSDISGSSANSNSAYSTF